MRLLQYESKEILAEKGIPTPAGIVFSNSECVSHLTPAVIQAWKNLSLKVKLWRYLFNKVEVKKCLLKLKKV